MIQERTWHVTLVQKLLSQILIVRNENLGRWFLYRCYGTIQEKYRNVWIQWELRRSHGDRWMRSQANKTIPKSPMFSYKWIVDVVLFSFLLRQRVRCWEPKTLVSTIDSGRNVWEVEGLTEIKVLWGRNSWKWMESLILVICFTILFYVFLYASTHIHKRSYPPIRRSDCSVLFSNDKYGRLWSHQMIS